MDYLTVTSMESLQATIECGFTLKHVRGMIRTYSQVQKTLFLHLFNRFRLA